MPETREPDEREEGKHGEATLISRRTLIRAAAGTALAWVTGCRLAPQAPTGTPVPSTSTPATDPTATESAPTATGEPASTATPTAPPDPTATATATPPPATATPSPALSREALMAHWPATASSRVVAVRHSGVWANGSPDPAIVLQMLDAGISALTDVADTLAVWRTLFDPAEQILLKVNCIAHLGPTQPAVTYAVAQRLQDAGMPPENVLIFDRTDGELSSAGYSLNSGGGGVQCHGAYGEGSQAALSQATVSFFQELDSCNALVNIPTPKQHSTAGISGAMKNHYGSVDRPSALHGNDCDPAIAEINNLPNVRQKTRLIVGAALNVSPFDWNQPVRENALLLSFDPVALDVAGRDILVRHRQATGHGVDFMYHQSRQLGSAQALGIGAADAGLIDLRETTLA